MNHLTFDKKDRTQARQLKKALQQSKGAEGPDDLPPILLNALGQVSNAGQLSIFNESFFKGILPGIRMEVITLLLKKTGQPLLLLSRWVPRTLEGGPRDYLCWIQASMQPVSHCLRTLHAFWLPKLTVGRTSCAAAYVLSVTGLGERYLNGIVGNEEVPVLSKRQRYPTPLPDESPLQLLTH